MPAKTKGKTKLYSFSKTPTGIPGLDQITGGGFPTGRPTLVCGGAGCGKTLLSIEFMVRGAMEFNEPGVFFTFEERTQDLAANVASLGFDLEKLQKNKKIVIDYVRVERSEIEETGEYDLEGLFIRLGYAIDSIGAKRVVLDTLENLFSGLSNETILRSELRRLFEWLKNKGVTAIITGERGEASLTRQGLEEYVSDCVILLENRVANQISTRMLRIIKYRGSVHGTNEYPFLIDEEGISVLPITSLTLNFPASSSRISTGIPSLDQMLGGYGFFRGSSILVSGTAGTGKTSIAASLADASCRRKEKTIYFAFEESPQQIMRNMGSIGADLQRHLDDGLLEMHASRPTLYGLEMHLVAIHKKIRKFRPKLVVLDPITNLVTVGSVSEVKSMLTRLIDFLLSEQITVVFTALTLNNTVNEQTDEGVSSLVDAWLQVRDFESNGERNRGLYIMKSRGMKHSNQVREFIITDKGLSLVDVYLGDDGVLIGSAREQQQLQDAGSELYRKQEQLRKDKAIARKEKILESEIAALRAEFETAKDDLERISAEENVKSKETADNRATLVRKRQSKNIENGKRS